MVKARLLEAAASPPRVSSVVDVWHHRAKLARQFTRGWGANHGAEMRARKWALLDQIRVLDEMADGPGLAPDDWILRYSLEASHMEIYKGEELYSQ